MKTRKQLKQLLAAMLSVVMVFTGSAGYVLAADLPDRSAKTEPGFEQIDPSTLNVKKLGTIPAEEEPEFDDPDTIYSADDIVRVSVVLERPSVLDAGYSLDNYSKNRSAKSYRSWLKGEQDITLQKISRTLETPLKAKRNLTLAINAVSVNVRYGDIEAIKEVDGVKDVVLENRYTAQTAGINTSFTSELMTEASAAWDAGYTGAGSRVAIIDTGIDYLHQSFDSEAFDYAIQELTAAGKEISLLTEEDVNALDLSISGFAQINNMDLYLNSKIPFAFNYIDMEVDDNNYVDHIHDTEGEHGSHVAGIAAANKYIKQGDTYVKAVDEAKAVGMAPDAQLLVMKVFGQIGGAYDSDYMIAIEDAIVLGADSINLSLGGAAPGYTYSDLYQDVLNKLSTSANTNAVVTISAGNNGAFTDETLTEMFIEDVSQHTGGSPGSFINSLGVASADNVGMTGMIFTFNGTNVYYSESKPAEPHLREIAGEQPFVYIDAFGAPEDYEAVNAAVSLAGKVVIVNRGGDINFAVKGNNAIPYNPKAVIVANNAPGLMTMVLDGYTGTFPMVSIQLHEGQMIKDASASAEASGRTYYTGTIDIGGEIFSEVVGERENATISSFSSWGIPGSLIMKPEITAPGGQIWSVYGASVDPQYGPGGGPTEYELMSGTSMAAPHMAGLSAVVAQYLRENPVADRNEALAAGYTTRAIVQSLLMSTATPMLNDGKYVSILQQGAGLADVLNAVKASSVVMVGDGDDTLTAALGSASDGKVKVEFGDDPDRTGVYEYSFTIHNISDNDLTFELDTKVFTQDHYEGNLVFEDYDGEEYEVPYEFMARTTKDLDADVTYGNEDSHDVDKDGDTDEDDAQALLDYLTGEVDGADLDLEAGEMDGEEGISTYDAYLLLNWKPGITVKAHQSRTVDVRIELTDSAKAELDSVYLNGAYIEGFTYVTSEDATSEGEDLSHEHTIPLLGFYGNWTDPSMFDNTSIIDLLYGTDKVNYSGNAYTNYMTVYYADGEYYFIGNPYAIEDEFPAKRLALRSDAEFGKIRFNLIRSAAGTGVAIATLDEPEGSVQDVPLAVTTGQGVDGLYFNGNTGRWVNRHTQTFPLLEGLMAADLEYEEGDVFRLGYYAVPEYYSMLVSDDLLSADAGILDVDGEKLDILIQNNMLGNGAYVGYDFTVDDTAPVISNVQLSDGKITVSASDNENLAYVAILPMDETGMNGTPYDYEVPGAPTAELTFDAAEYIAEVMGHVVVFAADYAGNETAVKLKVNDDVGIDPDDVYRVVVDPLVSNIYKGDTIRLYATVLPLTVEDRTVTWESSDPTIATVDENGVVTAVSEGQVSIMATANADGNTYGEATVNVTLINKDLRGIVYDSDENIFFSSFNTADIRSWSALHTDSQTEPFNAAFMMNASTLYAGTLDLQYGISDLYTVNRANYRPRYVGENYFYATDMALGSTNRTLQSYIGLVYTYANYLIAGNLTPDIYDPYTGSPYGFLNFGEHTDAYLAGVAKIAHHAGGYGTDDYIVLDEYGDLWRTTLSPAIEGNTLTGFNFSKPQLLASTGIETTFIYQSIYYDGTYLYWSHFDEYTETTELLILQLDVTRYNDTVTIFNAGEFGDSVWPVGGLYVDGKVAPASVGDGDVTVSADGQPEIEADEMLVDGSALKNAGPLLARDTLANEMAERLEGLTVKRSSAAAQAPATVIEETTEAVEETTEAVEETIEAVEETTEAVEETTEAVEETTEAVEETTEAVEETTEAVEDTTEAPADEDTTEAVNEVTGSLNAVRNHTVKHIVRNSVSAAQSAEQQGTEATEPGDVDLVESLDSTNGLFTVTYDKDLLKYIETASELEFKSVHADEENGKIVFAYAFKETEDAKNIPAGETLATVKFQAPCEDQQITVTTTERNTELDLNETADAELEGTGHDWQLDGFTWDGTESATANFVCANDETHTESVPAEVTSEVTPSTATAPGKTTYTATVEFGGETYTDEIVEEFSYAFTKGADGEYDVESGLAFDIEVKRSADDALTFGLFEALKMDGTVIAPANYTASEGSLKATLSAAYMATLDEGEHTLTAVFKDGVAETKLTVTQEDLTPPATGDRPGMLLWVILAAVMAAGMAALLIARRERF